MKNNRIYTFGAILAVAALAFGCQLDDSFEVPVEEKVPISLKGDINQLAVTRASDNGFAAGDQVGIWAVNYTEDTPGTLTLKDNQATNVRFTFDGSSTWTPDYDIYYKDKNTKVDIYGIYPYTSAISSIEAQPFEVQEDQSTISAHGSMGGYEASDFLWAKHEAAVPSPSVIQLLFQHKMSCVVVTLEKGNGFADGEFEALSQSVLINNVKRSALINLATGEATATGAVSARSTVPAAYENGFRAIVVPQTVSSASSLFSITLGGTAYTYSEGTAFTYVAGKQHNFAVTVDKKADGGYDVTVQTTISAWTNDNSSHEFTAKEYVVVDVETPGTLGETLTAAGKNPDAIKYIKVLGTVNADDFYFMRDHMAVLQGINMQETKVVEGKIPYDAFSGKTSLNSFVFPDGNHNNPITSIGESAFRGTLISGSLVIPEGVTVIEQNAFAGAKINNLYLPESLTCIERGAFEDCSFLTCDLSLPSGLKSIGDYCFSGCSGLSGRLILPEHIEYIGSSAFYRCGCSGTLEVPSTLSIIQYSTFRESAITGLVLHEGIKEIEGFAFASSQLKGDIVFPNSLLSIGGDAFSYTKISGELVFPESLLHIGGAAFKNCSRLVGTVTIPEGIANIEGQTFSGCTGVTGFILPTTINVIQGEAFSDCYSINSFVIYADQAPTIIDNAFIGVPKDNFTVEVPESSVNDYAYAPGWNEFQRITAHREFSISRRLYKTLNLEESRTFILRAKSGASWSIESKPDWVSVSPASGTGKTDVNVTVSALSQGSGDRNGEVVFLLDGKDYRSTMTVEQYDYAYGDGSVFTKQTHSKGSGIPLVFLGDCYDAADIASGSYLADTEEAIGYFFDIEPYKTYKDYFDVYVVFGKSEDSGVGSVNTIREAKFGTQYSLTGGALQNSGTEAFNYARKADPNMDITKGLVIMVLNSSDYGGVTYMWNDGSAIALCPKSTDPYPYDFRGLVQHEAGGHGFGKLADEYIYVNAFIDACSCGYEHLNEFRASKANGWYKNLSETANREEVPWSHLMYHPTYSNTVDIYEGGFFHTRGIFRSEPNSCMNNNIPYYSAISRQAIVERIMDYAGVPFNLDDFYANDAAALNTRASVTASPAWVPNPSSSTNLKHQHPIIMGEHPDSN
ncbi:MAG: leucine-rich repeat protein [Bacteroidales bacterium]|nr:leucine-rich repeat protein [Bacteroidales bacterium]